MDNAINMEAVQMMKYSPHTYKQVVQDCVAASQRVEGIASSSVEYIYRL